MIYSLGDALEELFRAGLVSRVNGVKEVTIHPSVQRTVRNKLSEADSIEIFDAVAHAVLGFPRSFQGLTLTIKPPHGRDTRCVFPKSTNSQRAIRTTRVPSVKKGDLLIFF